MRQYFSRSSSISALSLIIILARLDYGLAAPDALSYRQSNSGLLFLFCKAINALPTHSYNFSMVLNMYTILVILMYAGTMAILFNLQIRIVVFLECIVTGIPEQVCLNIVLVILCFPITRQNCESCAERDDMFTELLRNEV